MDTNVFIVYFIEVNDRLDEKKGEELELSLSNYLYEQ